MEFKPKSVLFLNLCSFYYTMLSPHSYTVNSLEKKKKIWANYSQQNCGKNQKHNKKVKGNPSHKIRTKKKKKKGKGISGLLLNK